MTRYMLAAIALATISHVTPAAGQLSEPWENAALSALRAAPLDSLLSPACRAISVDPEVRALHEPTIFGANAPTRFSLAPPSHSLGTRLPLAFNHHEASDSSSSTARVLIGMTPTDSGASQATFVIELLGCGLDGYAIRVDVSHNGAPSRVIVRWIHEG